MKSWKTRILNPGQRQTITVTLKKGVATRYLCTVPGPRPLGMKKTAAHPEMSDAEKPKTSRSPRDQPAEAEPDAEETPGERPDDWLEQKPFDPAGR